MTDTDRIDRAIQELDFEIRSISSEIDAFERFRALVRPLPIVSAMTTPTPESETALIVEYYRDTVAETGDFADAYDETVEEHMASELGSGAAGRLQRTEHVTGELKRRILAASERAADSRRTFASVLEAERESLVDARRAIGEIVGRLERIPECSVGESSLEDLVDAFERLERLADACDSVATRRQRFRSERRDPAFELAEPLQLDAYLYGDLESLHPVLYTVAETAAEIEHEQAFEGDRPLAA